MRCAYRTVRTKHSNVECCGSPRWRPRPEWPIRSEILTLRVTPTSLYAHAHGCVWCGRREAHRRMRMRAPAAAVAVAVGAGRLCHWRLRAWPGARFIPQRRQWPGRCTPARSRQQTGILRAGHSRPRLAWPPAGLAGNVFLRPVARWPWQRQSH